MAAQGVAVCVDGCNPPLPPLEKGGGAPSPPRGERSPSPPAPLIWKDQSTGAGAEFEFVDLRVGVRGAWRFSER